MNFIIHRRYKSRGRFEIEMLNGVYTIKYQESITRAISDLNKISHATKKAFAISEVEGLMMDEALGDKSVDYSDDTSKTKEYLKKASDAFDSEDSALVEEYCQKIFEVNPEKPRSSGIGSEMLWVGFGSI